MIGKDKFISLYVPKIPNNFQFQEGGVVSTNEYFWLKDLVSTIYDILKRNEGKESFLVLDKEISVIRRSLRDLGKTSILSLTDGHPLSKLFKRDTYEDRIAKSMKQLDANYNIIRKLDQKIKG